MSGKEQKELNSNCLNAIKTETFLFGNEFVQHDFGSK